MSKIYRTHSFSCFQTALMLEVHWSMFRQKCPWPTKFQNSHISNAFASTKYLWENFKFVSKSFKNVMMMNKIVYCHDNACGSVATIIASRRGYSSVVGWTRQWLRQRWNATVPSEIHDSYHKKGILLLYKDLNGLKPLSQNLMSTRDRNRGLFLASGGHCHLEIGRSARCQ